MLLSLNWCQLLASCQLQAKPDTDIDLVLFVVVVWVQHTARSQLSQSDLLSSASDHRVPVIRVASRLQTSSIASIELSSLYAARQAENRMCFGRSSRCRVQRVVPIVSFDKYAGDVQPRSTDRPHQRKR